MKIIKNDQKLKQVTVHIDSLDDLWTLSKIIQEKNIVAGMTQRKVKLGDGTERSAKISIRTVHLGITVEKVQYDPSLHQLRVLGTICSGPEDIPRGDHHSFGVSLGDEITITKEWKQYELQKLESAQIKRAQSLVVFFDREQAIIGVYTKKGFLQKTQLQGAIQKKDGQGAKSTFYEELANLISQQKESQSAEYVFCCAQQFWHQYLKEALAQHPQVLKKTTFHEIDDISDMHQILKSESFQKLVVDPLSTKIDSLFEQIITAIAKDGLAAYGLEPTMRAIEQGAASHILISNKLLISEREKNSTVVEDIISLAEQSKSAIHVVDEEMSIAPKLDGLGGIVALLRFYSN